MIKIHNSFSEDLQRIWTGLSKKAEIDIFQSYYWNYNWYKKIGKKNNLLLHILQVTSENETFAIYPFCIYQNYNVKILTFLGGSESDYHAPIILENSQQLLRSTSKNFSNKLPNYDLIHFKKIPERLLWSIDIIDYKYDPIVKNYDNSYFIKIEKNWDQFEKKMKSQLRRDTRRRFRKLLSHGKTELCVYNNKNYDHKNDFDKFSDFVKQFESYSKEKGIRNFLQNNANKDFYKSFITNNLREEISFNLAFLKVNSEIIASHWGISYNKTFYWIIPTFSNKWSFYSPGRLILYKLLEWCHSNNYKKFDLTIGDEGYKNLWTKNKSRLYEVFYKKSLIGQIFIQLIIIRRALQYNKVFRKLMFLKRKF